MGQTTGHNGDKLHLTITRAKDGADKLDAAVKAAHAQLTAPLSPARRGGQTTTCAKCQRTVLLSATNITALGNVCDACV